MADGGRVFGTVEERFVDGSVESGGLGFGSPVAH